MTGFIGATQPMLRRYHPWASFFVLRKLPALTSSCCNEGQLGHIKVKAEFPSAIGSVIGRPYLGDRKSLSIAKNHPKPSQDFSEQFGPSIHKMKGFTRNSPQKVHPNFAQNLGRQILGNTFSGLNYLAISHPHSLVRDCGAIVSKTV